MIHDSRMASLSVVIPAYNEEASLDDVLRRCLEVLPRCAEDFDVTVVNDGSTDRTAAIVREWSRRHPDRIRLVDHPARRGMAASFESAYRSGTKEFVVLLHADGQYPPEMLRECAALLPAHDVVLMTRRRKFYGWYRRLLSAGYRWLPRLLFGLDLHDPGCSKCIRRELIASTPLTSRGVFRDVERVLRIARGGGRVAFLPVDSGPRTGGKAHGSTLSISIRACIDMLLLRASLAVARKEP